MQLGDLGSAVSSPSGSGWSPAAKRHLVHFWSENVLSGKALNAAGLWGSAVSSPAGPGEAQPPNDILCNFGLKMLWQGGQCR